jgi:catechol 2,3-dioxygenase-like lactoylglutathione lyase family enzyme
VVLVVEDIDRSMAFYRDTLGLEPISPPELPVKFLPIGPQRTGIPQQIVLIPRHLAAEQPLVRTRVLHHIGLEVAPEDYDREQQRLADLAFELRGGQHPFMPVVAFFGPGWSEAPPTVAPAGKHAPHNLCNRGHPRSARVSWSRDGCHL